MDTESGALLVIVTEMYYWLTVVIMFFIHIGFCMYEVSASRHKNHLHTLMKNTMLIPLVTVTFFFFGWWIYFGLPNGPWITGPILWEAATQARPWDPLMGPHMGGADDPGGWARLNGVFWAAFLLFSWTAASIVSGAVIERVRSFAFWLLAILVGSITWMIDAAWGWHPDGWMIQVLGYHDAYASGVIHAIAGGSALAYLYLLGPRLGKFKRDGTARDLRPHNPWLVTIGLFLIYTGFWGFYAACNVPITDVQQGDAVFFSATNIYGTPTTLSAITVNFIMSLAGGLLTGYAVSKGNGFWTYSGGLAGIIAASAGNDLYHPIQALLVAAAGTWFMYVVHYWVERNFKIDDAVGAVAVHGYAGFFGVVIAGFLLWGYPASAAYDAVVTPWGQFIGAIIMFWVLGFLPALVLGLIMKAAGVLRIPQEIELAGLDIREVQTHYDIESEIRATEEELARGTAGA